MQGACIWSLVGEDPAGCVVAVQSLSCVLFFATPWAAALQASLSFIISRSCSNSCPLGQWCHPTISSSVAPCSSYPQYFPASVSFPMSQLFASCDQSIGASVSASCQVAWPKRKKKNRSSLRKAGKSWLPHSWSTNRLEENQQGKLWRCSKSYLAMNTLFVVDLQKSRSLDSRGQGDQTGQS